MANLPIPANGRNIGECVYCGVRDEQLQKEHAVPYGLNGSWTLLRASCRRCAEITHRFERDTLRGLLPSVRNVLAMQSRRRHERSGSLPLMLERGGVQETVEVPIADFPLYLPVPTFPRPGFIEGRSITRDIPTTLKFIHIAGSSFEQISKRYAGVDFVGARIVFSPNEFARTLAKIAFCGAVYALGLAPFADTPIRRVILGEDKHVGHWVGCWDGEPINAPQGLHAMQVRASGTDIHVVLRLFAQFGAPEYHIALGPADPDFVRSEDWPWR